jgi:hypothetical protein
MDRLERRVRVAMAEEGMTVWDLLEIFEQGGYCVVDAYLSSPTVRAELDALLPDPPQRRNPFLR